MRKRGGLRLLPLPFSLILALGQVPMHVPGGLVDEWIAARR
jgi:hypothetical protein